MRSAKIHDTCGVNNLHGMPGILGAIISAISCALASKNSYAGRFDVTHLKHAKSGSSVGRGDVSPTRNLHSAIVF